MNSFPAILKLVFLLLLGALLWSMQAGGLRDASAWLAAGTAPFLAIWLGWPWQLHRQPGPFSWGWGGMAAGTFLLASLLDIQALLACGWTALAAA